MPTDPRPKPCPRCGTEGCPSVGMRPLDEEDLLEGALQTIVIADIACSLRAIQQALERGYGRD